MRLFPETRTETVFVRKETRVMFRDTFSLTRSVVLFFLVLCKPFASVSHLSRYESTRVVFVGPFTPHPLLVVGTRGTSEKDE